MRVKIEHFSHRWHGLHWQSYLPLIARRSGDIAEC